MMMSNRHRAPAEYEWLAQIFHPKIRGLHFS